LIERAQDCFQYAINVSHDIVVPESENEITHRFERTRPVGISLFVLFMLPAIDFDDQLSVGAKEINDEAIDRYLSLEFPSIEPAIAQAKPQHALGVGLIATQSSSELGALYHHRSTSSILAYR